MTNPTPPSLIEICKSETIPVQGNRIVFPAYVKRIKLDVGLSNDAGQSLQWLNSDPDLGVVGIEPLQENVNGVKELVLSRDSGTSLEGRFHILPIALGTKVETRTIFVTSGDAGSSSLFKPLSILVLREETVRVFRLDEVLDLIDERRFPIIHFLKLDCQGSDLEILKSASSALRRVAVVTAEAEDTSYLGTSNSEEEMDLYMTSQGFMRHNPRSPLRRKVGSWLAPLSVVHTIYGFLKRMLAHFSFKKNNSPLQVEDPTYVNKLFATSVYSGEITAWQKG